MSRCGHWMEERGLVPIRVLEAGRDVPDHRVRDRRTCFVEHTAGHLKRGNADHPYREVGNSLPRTNGNQLRSTQVRRCGKVGSIVVARGASAPPKSGRGIACT